MFTSKNHFEEILFKNTHICENNIFEGYIFFKKYCI